MKLLFLGVLLSCASPSFAAEDIELLIRGDLAMRHRGHEFSSVLDDWRRRFGTRAVPALLRLSADQSLEDPHRYVALMAAVKLGGHAMAPRVIPFLRDPSWMLRSGALKLVAGLRILAAAPEAIELLRNDPSLVVRSRAVEVVEALRPSGASVALIEAVVDARNYHGGKAQGVPQKALKALAALGAQDSVPTIRSLLKRSWDPALRTAAVGALESLLASGEPTVAVRIRTTGS